MHVRVAQKLAVGAAGLVGLGMGSFGLGVGFAAPAHSSVTQPPAANSQANNQPATDSSAESDGPGGHQDPPGVDVQSGSQTSPDTGGDATAEAGV